MSRTKRLQVPELLNETRARKMLIDLVRYGNWCRMATPFIPSDAVRDTIRQSGFQEKLLVSRARHFFGNIGAFENLIGPTWQGSGGWQVMHDSPDGTQNVVVEGSPEGGSITMHDYWAKFDAACDALLRFSKSADLEEFLGATTKGLASIDSFIFELAQFWNLDNRDQVLFDLADRKANTEEKLRRSGKVTRGCLPKLTQVV